MTRPIEFRIYDWCFEQFKTLKHENILWMREDTKALTQEAYSLITSKPVEHRECIFQYLKSFDTLDIQIIEKELQHYE